MSNFEEEQLVTGETPSESEGPVTPVAPPPSIPGKPPTRRRRPPSVFWPIMFIGAGVVLLLANLGYLPPLSWGVIWRLWPLLIIALGVDLLIGQRSVAGAIVSAVLICVLIGAILLVSIFAQNIPGVSNWIKTPELQTQHVEYPLAGLERATVSIDWASAPGYLSVLEDSPNLVVGDITYRGGLPTFDVKLHGDQADVKLYSSFAGFWFGPWGERTEERWDVMLSPNAPLDLTLDTGSGPCDFDLTGLNVSNLVLDAGSGPVDLVLPSGNTFEATIDGGSGPITIILPESLGAQVVLDSGSGPFNPDTRFQLVKGKLHGDGTWETKNYRTAEHTILFEIDQGSGPITIR